jgi:DNA-binding response OmpR family regulator
LIVDAERAISTSINTDLYLLSWTGRIAGVDNLEKIVSRSLDRNHERIVITDSNASFRESLAQDLRAGGFEVVTAATGENAFHLLRSSGHTIDWLYTKADLPGLIDGWILADEYHAGGHDRAAVIAAASERVSGQDHLVLKEPSVAAALDAIRAVTTRQKPGISVAVTDANPRRLA